MDLVYGPTQTELIAAAAGGGRDASSTASRSWSTRAPLAADLDRARAPDRGDASSGTRSHDEPMERPPRTSAARARPGRRRRRAARRARAGHAGTPRADAAARQRGSSAMFITDVIVELGYATRERGRRGRSTRRAPPGRSPEALLLEQQRDRRRPALARDRRALRARPRRPRRLPRRHGRGEPDLASSAARRYQAVPVGYVDDGHAAARDGRPGERARRRRHPDDHRPHLPGRGRRRRTTSRR